MWKWQCVAESCEITTKDIEEIMVNVRLVRLQGEEKGRIILWV